ncbi:PAS domain S-box protein [Halovenus rubra]|uniref:histidine kinase n=2 Tax=Halovenus rubra TaxID=869890 RepID=A0ABD5X4J8_9EURY|nr:PAS domain S-box protein [Halovenus rubra]
METAIRLLVVDATKGRRNETERLLEQALDSPSITSVPDASSGLAELDTRRFDCIVSAYDVGEKTGVSFMEAVTERAESVPFVLFTESDSADIATEVYTTDRAAYVLNVTGAKEPLRDSIQRLVKARQEESTRDGNQISQGQELARERERFSDLFSNFPEPTIAYGFEDGNTVFKSVNDAFEDVFGIEEQEIRDCSVNNLIVPDNIQAESNEIDNQIDSGKMVDRVVRRLAANGTSIFNLRSIPVRTPGEIEGFAVYSDITERKRREGELEQYETIVQTIPMGVLTVDEDWRISDINEPGASIVGYTAAELVGQPFINLQADGIISEDVFELSREIVEELRSNSDVRKKVIEVSIETRSGISRELEVHASLLPASSDFSGVVLVFHDITERKENEQELKRQNERLEEFASIVSHDLRNPLNVAMGHLEIVQSNHNSESVDQISDALNRMETLIRETLQLAKQGQMVTETQEIQLSSCLSDCWGMVDQSDATLKRTGDMTIEGDRSRVRQLFENLFRNATEHGGSDVTVRVQCEDETIVVADDGPGIPPDKRDGIFETGQTTSEDGAGFGLAIVKEIVEAHDWEITVSESVDGGARFEIRGFDKQTTA